jgi:hypothetical protein
MIISSIISFIHLARELKIPYSPYQRDETKRQNAMGIKCFSPSKKKTTGSVRPSLINRYNSSPFILAFTRKEQDPYHLGPHQPHPLSPQH